LATAYHFPVREGAGGEGAASQKTSRPFCGQSKVQESFIGEQIAVHDLWFWQFGGQAITGQLKVFLCN